MKKDFPDLAVQPLFEAIQNTIRVFDEYRLDQKTYANNTYKILHSGGVLQFRILLPPSGTQLEMIAISSHVTEAKTAEMVGLFFSRLDQILNGKIVLTPETVNRDVYKRGQTAFAAIWLFRAVIAAIAIIFGLRVLSGC